MRNSIKKLFLFLVLLALVITPLRVQASFEEAGGDEGRSSEQGIDRTGENSTAAATKAAKASSLEATVGAGSEFIDDDDSGQEEVSAGENSIGTTVDDSSDLVTSQKKSASGASSKKEKVSSAVSQGGLSNNRADCFINSSLQLVKAFKEQLDPEALARMSSLSRFLNEGLSTDEECRVLRHEMATKVIKGDQDLQEAIQEGTAQTHQDAVAFLRLFLAETKAPKIALQEQLENLTTRDTRIAVTAPERILQLALPEDRGGSISMQDLINTRLVSTREQHWVDEDLTSPVVEVRSQLVLRNDSIPQTFVVSLGRFGFDGHGVKNQIIISGFKNRITLSAANGEQITYEPMAIICHLGDTLEVGHYITHRKENGSWTAFNDDEVVASRLKDGGTASQNCYVISYRRVHDGEPDEASERDDSRTPSVSTASRPASSNTFTSSCAHNVHTLAHSSHHRMR